MRERNHGTVFIGNLLFCFFSFGARQIDFVQPDIKRHLMENSCAISLMRSSAAQLHVIQFQCPEAVVLTDIWIGATLARVSYFGSHTVWPNPNSDHFPYAIFS